MKRKLTIEVKTVKEFEAIKLAIEKPDVKALLIMVGILDPLDQHEQSFILRTVNEIFELKKDRR